MIYSVQENGVYYVIRATQGIKYFKITILDVKCMCSELKNIVRIEIKQLQKTSSGMSGIERMSNSTNCATMLRMFITLPGFLSNQQLYAQIDLGRQRYKCRDPVYI